MRVSYDHYVYRVTDDMMEWDVQGIQIKESKITIILCVTVFHIKMHNIVFFTYNIQIRFYVYVIFALTSIS